MKGFVLAEEGHVVQAIAPVSSGQATAQRFSMKDYQHASILVLLGVQSAAFDKIVVKACTKSDGTGATAIPFALYAQETGGASHDVLGTRQEIAAAGYTPSANNAIFYVIELDAQALPDGSPWVEVDLASAASPGVTNLASVVAVLSGARYAERQSPTVTA